MSDQQTMTKAELLAKIQASWDDITGYLKSLTVEQITQITDAAGWTVKDHVAHIMVWEDGINALLDRQPRYVRMGVDAATWNSGDYDRMNAIIQQRHRGRSWDEVMQTFMDVHEQLIAKLETLTDADLMRPYRDYQPESTSDGPIYNRICGNTFGHYAEHTPWIAAIAAAGS